MAGHVIGIATSRPLPYGKGFIAGMNVKDIESAIAQLPPSELEEFTAWFEEFLAEAWDEQIKVDVQAGRLDALLQQAEWEFEAGVRIK
ncbi:MAG TPA: hypothetical protein VGE45_20510 [Chloroflexia bacterium]